MRRERSDMPLQNRVTPYGDIEALPGRGLVIGNRGVLVDDERRIVRPYQVQRWIACRLHVPGRRRALMQPRRWTELFFLDEAAAFAAGHRPCAECRNAAYKRFKALWISCYGEPAGADDIDDVLHADRLVGRRAKRTYRERAARLPDGAYAAIDGAPGLVWRSAFFPWSDAGYTARRPVREGDEAVVLTPRSIVNILRAGYETEVHSSVETAPAAP
jgi:hypothetical protein